MTKMLSTLLGGALALNAVADGASARGWDALPSQTRVDILEQVLTRREGERLVVLRKSKTDIYREQEVSWPVHRTVRRRLMALNVVGALVLGDLYPFGFAQQDVLRGILVYSRVPPGQVFPMLQLPAEHPVLCILDRANGIRRDLTNRNGLASLDHEFVRDVATMPESDWIAKYGMSSVFSNQVYHVRPGCAWLVDCPTPDDAGLFIYGRVNGMEDPRFAADRRRIAESKERARRQISRQGMVALTPEEMSELVAFIGCQWYRGDSGRYRALRMSYPWLLSVDVRSPKTSLGRDIKEALSRDGCR